MSRFATLALALENEEITANAGENTVTTDELAVATDIETKSADISADMEANTTAEADIEQVEEFKEILEEASANGTGIDTTAAALATVATENLRNKFYITSTTRDMPSLESFGTTSSRATATALAIESMGDAISNAWARVVEFFKNIVAKIKEFLRSVFTSVGRLEVRAKNLSQSSANKTATTKISEDSFKSRTLAEQFSTAKDTKASFKTVEAFYDSAAKFIEGVTDVSVNFSKSVNVKKSEADLKALLTSELNKVLDNSALEANAGLRTVIGSTLFVSDEMIGGTVFIAELSNSNVDTKNFKLTDSEKKQKGFKVLFSGIKKLVTANGRELDEEVPTLKKDEIKKICSSTINMCTRIQKFKRAEDGLAAMTKAIEKAAKEAVAVSVDPAPADKTATSHTAEEMKNYFYNTGKILNAMSLHAVSIAVKTANGGLNYVDGSLRQYKKD